MGGRVDRPLVRYTSYLGAVAEELRKYNIYYVGVSNIRVYFYINKAININK